MRALRLRVALVVAPLLLAACNHRSEPAKSPQNGASESLYNDGGEPSTAGERDAQASADRLLAAQVRITNVLAQALRVGAALWLTTSDKCPTPADIVNAHLVSASLRTTDAWDHEYAITCETKGPVVTSAGPDGAFGTADDLVVGK